MKFFIFLLLTPLFFSNYSVGDIDLDEYSQREQVNPKISTILLNWRSSANHDEFAKANGLLYKDGMIQIYIHLTGKEFLSQIPSEINVVASDQKIAVAYVTPQQLDIFENLDFVDRVTPPDLAVTPPIPQITTPEKTLREEKSDFRLIEIVVILAVIITILVIFLKRKKTKSA